MFIWKSPSGNCHFCNSTYEYSFSNFSIVWVIINNSKDKIKFSNMITYSSKESYVYLTFIIWYSFSCLCLIIIFMVARYWILDHQVRKKLYCFSRKKITGRAIGCTIQIKHRIHELKFQGFVRLLKYKLQV